MLRDPSPWMVDARDNTGTHWFILVPATGSYIQQGVCECTVLSCTGGACSRGYKRGERGRKAPKSLLEEEMIEASANIGAQESGCVCSASYVCVGDEIVKIEPASSFYRHKEGRSTRTRGGGEVVVFPPNCGCAVGDYCRKYTVGH